MSRSNPSSLAREENERQAVALDEEMHAAGKDSPLLLEEEREQAAKSKLVGARVIHEVLRHSGAAAPFVIIILTYVVGLGGFPHIIAGSTEAAYAVVNGVASVQDYLVRFFAPTLLGNLIGGTALAALLNHAPVAHDFAADRKED